MIASILAVVAIPRLSRSAFDDGRLYDETNAALRYAQRVALAWQRTVCVSITSTGVTLRYRSAYGDTSCTYSAADTALLAPGAASGAATYTVTRQGAATLSPAVNFYFDRLGRPSFASAQTITISASRSIVVEAETGYVH